MVERAIHRPAVQRVSVERGRVRQRLFGMHGGVMVARLRLIGRLLDDAMSRPSALQSSASSTLTFDASARLGGGSGGDFTVGLAVVGGAYGVSQVPVPQTFQCERLVQAACRLLQLGVLVGGQLWGAGGQQVWMGVGLDGGQRRIVGIGLLRWEERAAGFGASHRDSPLVAMVTAVGGRGSLLGGVSVVEQLLLRCDWLPAGM